MSCARTRTSVGPPRWTWRSTCSTACWTWDARPTSASPDPKRGWGQCAPSPDPCNTAALAHGRASGHRDGRGGPRAQPHAGPGTPDLRPHHLTPNGAGVSAPPPLIRATQPRSHTDERRATEMDVAVHVLNRMLDLGRPTYVRIT